MKFGKFPQRATGFSLIEVMVAIVIISIGLLALASLQLALIRSSSETKAQSIGMALAKQRLETAAAYTSMAAYRGITDDPMVAVPGNPIGGVDYQWGLTVERYVYDRGAAGAVKYVRLALDTQSDDQVKSLDPDYMPGREFKRVVATVQWTDAAGAIQRVRVEDAISALEPTDTIAINKNQSFGAPRKAISVITNPAAVAGVIPIAIGNGTDTAATNPRPILLAQGNSKTLVETRFDIFTYAAINASSATAQSRVETAVVGCTCRTASGTQETFRPTYWDGSIYTVPDTAANTRRSAAKTGIDQSTLCTACCRDHHDQAGVTGPKFDPRRASHNHYLASDLTTPVDMSTANNDYSDSCRLIRVDGVFRVAAETYNDYFGLLATAGLNQSTPSTTIAQAVPGTTQTSAYQTFVLNYLNARFITGPQSNYNVPIDWAAVTGNSTLDSPSSASIATASNPQYLHSRGLYIDYLTDEVRQMVRDAGLAANCTGTDNQPANSTAEFQACVFKLLPFTSINLTEIAAWSATQPTKVEVVNNAFKDTVDSAFPVKGKADLKIGAINGDTSIGRASVQRSSAGLAVASKVFPDTELYEGDHVRNILTDETNQLFTVGAVSGTPSNDKFWVSMIGADLMTVIAYGSGNAPQVGFSLGNSACNTDENTGSDATATGDLDGVTSNDNSAEPDEFRCVPDSGQSMGGTVAIELSNYNREGAVTVQNACRNSGDTNMPFSKDLDVTGITVGIDANADGDYLDTGDAAPVSLGITGSVTNSERPGIKAVSGEYTSFSVAALQTLSRVDVTFSAKDNRCPANWANFVNASGNRTSLTNTQKNDTAYCIGSGSNAAPNWNQTSWVACPNGIVFP